MVRLPTGPRGGGERPLVRGKKTDASAACMPRHSQGQVQSWSTYVRSPQPWHAAPPLGAGAGRRGDVTR